ncbi:hypothetical protein GUJ93_ZPchr0001g32297 [Zizania palustris]|uniref:BHLH domain-containing protein n=1 Tax=Zizania palustris TaxID=103762 RepID=A0A8J5RXW8_ZIZPA|nr:hypothetical protein GUJ93_ZPchr0001g32297 [Zizania palustris]
MRARSSSSPCSASPSNRLCPGTGDGLLRLPRCWIRCMRARVPPHAAPLSSTSAARRGSLEGSREPNRRRLLTTVSPTGKFIESTHKGAIEKQLRLNFVVNALKQLTESNGMHLRGYRLDPEAEWIDVTSTDVLIAIKMHLDVLIDIKMHPSAAGNHCHRQQQGHIATNNFGFASPGSSADIGLEIHESSVSNGKPPPAKAAQKRACPAGGEARTTAGKKQCRKSKANAASPAPAPTKHKYVPQSAAAKVRRERISEKLRVLQDLVPNGTKKAINYVKFLQLQVKVLATDEFWPAQGGKAPELAQVKDALDTILSSQHPNK